MAGKKVVRNKRKVSKNIEAGVAHIRSTFNNTIVTISDTTGAEPNTGIISRLDSLPAQEKPAMASTPSPPSSPCLTVVMMVPLACWTLLGADSRKISLA